MRICLAAVVALAVTLAAARPATLSGEHRDVAQAPAPRRVALVVGNDRYPGAMALQNARRDAGAVATELRGLGFTATLLEDATRAQFISALETLSKTLQPSDVVIFYYAGHGAQVSGENFLVPVDYRGDSEERLMADSVSAEHVQRSLARAQVSILILDACRNNPYTGQRSGGTGLAPMEARGSIVAFATSAGQTASDNQAGAQGTFTGALLETLRQPGLPIREVFAQVRRRVFDASRGRQIPAVYDNMLGDVILRPGAVAPAAGPSNAPAPLPPARPPASVTSPPVAVPSAVPDWIVGDFRGSNALTRATIELTIQPDGRMSGISTIDSARRTPVAYEWVPATRQIRDPSGAYVFDVERTDKGFRTKQVGSPANAVDYQRVYLPPGSQIVDARGLNRDVNRQATPDELGAMVAVLTEWKGAWESLDVVTGRRLYPSWDAEAVRRDRIDKGVEKVTVTLTCTYATVRRDQARVPCRGSMQTEFKRQLISSRGSQTNFLQKPPPRTQVVGWTFGMFWNGSTWLIESLN